MLSPSFIAEQVTDQPTLLSELTLNEIMEAVHVEIFESPGVKDAATEFDELVNGFVISVSAESESEPLDFDALTRNAEAVLADLAANASSDQETFAPDEFSVRLIDAGTEMLSSDGS